MVFAPDPGTHGKEVVDVRMERALKVWELPSSIWVDSLSPSSHGV